MEPIYLQAEQGRLPEMKRVVLASGNRVAMEPTVAEALRSLLAEPGTPADAAARRPGTTPAGQAPPRAGDTDPKSLLRALIDRQGRISEELKALDADLRRLRELLEKEK